MRQLVVVVIQSANLMPALTAADEQVAGATCTAGNHVISGGSTVLAGSADPHFVVIGDSGPDGNMGWRVRAIKLGGVVGGTWGITVLAICANVQ